jgi:hypothetical protein
MKKILFTLFGIFAGCCFASDRLPDQSDLITIPPHDTAGFSHSMTQIQANYNEMYRALPSCQQNRIQSAATTMENLRLKPPLDAQLFITTEQSRSELSMKTSVSRMLTTDAAKVQIEDARHEIYQRINEKILDLKARRKARR